MYFYTFSYKFRAFIMVIGKEEWQLKMQMKEEDEAELVKKDG